MDILSEVTAVPIIVTLVYLIVYLIKTITCNHSSFEKFIPIIAGGLGIVLGIAAHFVAPSVLPAGSNFLSAALIGGVSGLAATGTHQIFKQLSSSCPTDDGDNGEDAGGETPE